MMRPWFNRLKYIAAVFPTNLLCLAGLVVVDGWLVQFVLKADYSLAAIILLGCFGFAGCGSFSVAATELRGPLRLRFALVGAVYAVILVATVGMTLISHLFAASMPPNSNMLLGLFVAALGCQLSGLPGLRTLGAWRGLTATLDVLVALTFLQGLHDTLDGRLPLHLYIDPTALCAVCLAWLIGLMLTSMGVLVGFFLSERVSLQPLRRGAAVSFLMIAEHEFMRFNLPAAVSIGSWTFHLQPVFLILGPMIAGLLWTIVSAVYHALRKPRG